MSAFPLNRETATYFLQQYSELPIDRVLQQEAVSSIDAIKIEDPYLHIIPVLLRKNPVKEADWYVGFAVTYSMYATASLNGQFGVVLPSLNHYDAALKNIAAYLKKPEPFTEEGLRREDPFLAALWDHLLEVYSQSDNQFIKNPRALREGAFHMARILHIINNTNFPNGRRAYRK